MGNNIVSARMFKEDRALLKRVCKTRWENFSDFVRRSIQKKANFCFWSTKALGIGQGLKQKLAVQTFQKPHLVTLFSIPAVIKPKLLGNT